MHFVIYEQFSMYTLYISIHIYLLQHTLHRHFQILSLYFSIHFHTSIFFTTFILNLSFRQFSTSNPHTCLQHLLPYIFYAVLTSPFLCLLMNLYVSYSSFISLKHPAFSHPRTHPFYMLEVPYRSKILPLILHLLVVILLLLRLRILLLMLLILLQLSLVPQSPVSVIYCCHLRL